VSEKSARSNCDRQRFPKWNDTTQFFVRRCSLGLRKSVTRIIVRGRRFSKRRFLITLDLRRQSTLLRNKLAATVRQRLKRGEGSTRPSTDKDDAQLPEGGALESKFALCYRVCRKSCPPRAKADLQEGIYL